MRGRPVPGGIPPMSLRPLLSRLALVLAASGLILVAAEMISRAAEPGPF